MTVPEPGPSSTSTVTLREVTADTVRAICKLAVEEQQTKFVAANALSISQAYFSEHAWFRAIYADEAPVGFVMLDDQPAKTEYFLWRFMIDTKYQGMGFGRRAIELVVEHVKTRPRATEFLTSVVQGEGSPQQFYEKLGFKSTGKFEDGEAILRLEL